MEKFEEKLEELQIGYFVESYYFEGKECWMCELYCTSGKKNQFIFYGDGDTALESMFNAACRLPEEIKKKF